MAILEYFWAILGHFGGNFGIFWQFFKIFCQLIWCSHSCYHLCHLGNPKMANFTYFQPFTQCCHFLLFFRLAYQFSPLREGNLGWHKKILHNILDIWQQHFFRPFHSLWGPKLAIFGYLKKSVFSFSAHFREVEL